MVGEKKEEEVKFPINNGFHVTVHSYSDGNITVCIWGCMASCGHLILPSQATGLGFVCFVVINPRVFSANRVYFGLFCFINCPFTPPPQLLRPALGLPQKPSYMPCTVCLKVGSGVYMHLIIVYYV